MNQNTPQTVSQLYPDKWLRPSDLGKRSVIVTVEACTIEEVHSTIDRESQQRAILDFGRTKRLILNKTQCQAMTQITDSETFHDWPGHRIQLTPARARNGKATIHISAAPKPLATDEP